MLFKGEAIFGVVDFSARGAARCRAEQLSQQAKRLGVFATYQDDGRAALGRVSRRSFAASAAALPSGGSPRVAIAGEAVCLGQAQADRATSDDGGEWIGRGFQRHGTDFLRELDGTFALALWDADKLQLTLLTDRRSDAQIFFRYDGEQILFSSWLSLLAGPDVKVDRGSVQEFLRFLYLAAPRTIYRGIARVEPGHYVAVSPRGLTTEALRQVEDRGVISDAERTLDEFRERFEKAIERRIAGRRVGVFLSSGVDSATLLAACRKIYPANVEAYTIGFDMPELDETRDARAYASHLGVPHTVLRYGLADYGRAFAMLAREFEQPFADPASLPLILASAEVGDRVDVITGGTGGDDLFGAPIPRHLRFSLEVSAKLPAMLRRQIARITQHTPGAAGYASLFDFDDVRELLITWPGWSGKDLAELFGEKISFEDSGFYRVFEKHRRAGAQDLYDALGVFPPDDCRFHAAAPANIAVQLPYHDAELRAFVEALPRSLRMRGGEAKVLLKQLFAAYYPPELQLAKKHYFNIPLCELLAHNGFELVRAHLSREMVMKHQLVDYHRLRPWIDRFLAGDRALLFKIWSLAVLHAWVDARSA